MENGPKVLFNRAHPDGVPLADGSVNPMVYAALSLASAVFDAARAVHTRGGKVLIETPVGHGKDSLWPIKGREEHSTLYDTSLFKEFANDVPGEVVYSDQCVAGAETRKTTQFLYANEQQCQTPQNTLATWSAPALPVGTTTPPHSLARMQMASGAAKAPTNTSPTSAVVWRLWLSVINTTIQTCIVR